MKLTLVQPKNSVSEVSYVPLGLISVGGFVEDHTDWEVKIVDLRYDDEESIWDCDVAGFSMLTGQGICEVVRLCKEAKKRGIKTVVGGMHPTLLPGQTSECEMIDHIIVGFGEESMVEVLNGCSDRIIDKGKFIKDHFLDWSLVDLGRYNKRVGGVNIFTSIGCPFPCSFCYNTKAKRIWVSREERVIDWDVGNLKSRGINHVIVHDDNFVVDKRHALKIAEKFDPMEFSINIRIDSIDYEFMRKMRDFGLVEVRIGCESGSNRVLREVVRKGIRKEDTIKGVEICRDLGIKALLSFVIGWPGETEDERKETVELCVKLRDMWDGVSVYPLWIYNPYPGTELGRRSVELGWTEPQRLEDWGRSFWGRANLPWIKDGKKYERIHVMSRAAWYNRRNPVRKAIRWVATKRLIADWWGLALDVLVIKWLMRLYQWGKRKVKR